MSPCMGFMTHRVSVITDKTKGSGVAPGVRDARESACEWAGIAWTTLLLNIKLGACLGLAGSFCNTLQISCASSCVYDSFCLQGDRSCSLGS
jgi:hypothetical protein